MVKAPVPDDFSNAFIELGIQDVAKKEGLC